MSDGFFCAVASRAVGEDLIGTATPYQTYVLIECPKPWPPKVLTSAAIPTTLRQFMAAMQAEHSVNFLLVDQGRRGEGTRVIVYQQPAGLSQGYEGTEFWVGSLDGLEVRLRQIWEESSLEGKAVEQRDILVCTHGQRDRCCARYGRPFYRQAVKAVEAAGLTDVRLWQVSHIGGHRFAPTVLDLPEGRCYGRLTPETFRTILTHSGSIDGLKSVYRGWSRLPQPLQGLERQLMLDYGWVWFQCRVGGALLEADDSGVFLADLSVQTPDQTLKRYRAKIAPDPEQTCHLKASCNADQVSEVVKYGLVGGYWVEAEE